MKEERELCFYSSTTKLQIPYRVRYYILYMREERNFYAYFTIQ